MANEAIAGTARGRAASLRSTALRRILKENGLSIVLISMFLGTLIPMSIAGHHDYLETQKEHGEAPLTYMEYLSSDHFVEAMMENWESEFLQMAAFVLLTAFLFQKGSSESKRLDGPEEVDHEPSKRSADAPWPVSAGGLVLKLYENSLFLAFFLLFAVSFYFHASSGAGDYNRDQALHGGREVSVSQYLVTARFWFESLQNWQSESLALLAMVVLSIYLRQKGSPQSKPVDSPYSHTGR